MAETASPDGSRSAVKFAATLLFVLPRIAHELTHVVAAWPWAQDWQVVLDEEGGLAAIKWQDDAPWWGRWLAYYAPLLSALALGTGVVTWTLLHGFQWPETVVAQAKIVVLVGWWAMYGRISHADRQGAREARRDG